MRREKLFYYVRKIVGKKRSFFGKFGVLCILVTSVLRFALLPYYQRNVHFTFRDVYLHTDGVAMSSPLGPALAGKFMIYLERSLVPLLTAELSFWK